MEAWEGGASGDSLAHECWQQTLTVGCLALKLAFFAAVPPQSKTAVFIHHGQRGCAMIWLPTWWLLLSMRVSACLPVSATHARVHGSPLWLLRQVLSPKPALTLGFCLCFLHIWFTGRSHTRLAFTRLLGNLNAGRTLAEQMSYRLSQRPGLQAIVLLRSISIKSENSVLSPLLWVTTL